MAIHITALGFDAFKKAPNRGTHAPQGAIIHHCIETVKRNLGISRRKETHPCSAQLLGSTPYRNYRVIWLRNDILADEVPAGPNDIWAADYKGQFRLKNGKYCFPLTVSDLSSRFILGIDAHPAISLEKTFAYFRQLFETYGLPNRIRTDNGVPFASNALARLSQLSVWFIKLGIYPELIEPGEPQQNGVHERMHRTLKEEATIPPGSSLRAQQNKFDLFREEFNDVRPHEAIGMKRPVEIFQASERRMPKRIETYDYPDHFLVRRVSRAGTIRVFHNQVFVSNTLHEDYVGLEEVADGVYDLYFCFYQIGRYELQLNKIQGIVSKVALSVKRVDLVSRV